MIAPELVWKSKWDQLRLDPIGSAYAYNIANLVQDCVIALTVPGLTGATAFTFNTAMFASAILAMQPSENYAAAAQAYSNAFSSSCTTSILTVAGGASVGSPSPATTFASPPTALFEPASVAAAAANLFSQLLTAQPVYIPLTSIYPIALRTAFTSLQISATGINILVPTPTPLIFTGGVL